MEIIGLEKLNWLFLEKENIELGLFPNEGDSKLSISHARIKPGETMTEHYHQRPDNGHEVYFFYTGGHFIIKSDDTQKEFNTEKPFYWAIQNRERHSITNLDDKILEFQAIYAPGFVEGEVKFN